MTSVIIVGAGPAGLSAARCLTEAGLRDILVLERNREAGGLPRSCGHPGWGMLDQHRILTGPAYARRLVSEARGAVIRTDATVTALLPGGGLNLSSASGLESLSARAVLLATGIRETPRSARLVSGTRPWGVITTGAFQDIVYRGSLLPFRRPVIIGSELVSFSALLTARHAGIRPVAMVEPASRTIARWPSALLPRLLGVELLLDTRLIEIIGSDRVEAVRVATSQGERRIACDGVLFTGEFTPAAEL